MKTSNLKLLFFTVFAICLLTFCERDIKFEGTFIDKKTESKILVIKKISNTYFVNINGEKLPAKLSDNQLIVDNGRSIAIDKKSQTIVFSGEDYIPMDGNQFLGKWSYGNRSDVMEITKKGVDFYVVWKSNSDIYQPHEVISKLIDGNLIGDYYGEKNNFVIKVVGNKRVSLSIDPFAEFEPVRNEYFSPTQSVFIASNGEAFLGYWSDKYGPSINISKAGSNYDVILLLDKTKWQWSAYFKNEQLTSIQSIEGQIPVIKLISEDSILLIDFYMGGSSDQGMKLVSRNPQKASSIINKPSNSENSQRSISENNLSTLENTNRQQSNSSRFYIINVTAVQTEIQAKTKVAQLKNDGNIADYLWIPDYSSLSGAKLYSVYIGPYSTQHDCEVATEEYRKKHPQSYGLLVSQDKKRVQINGIGKVTITTK